jgi:hypothetical protein
MTCPAGVFASRRTNPFVERMIPTKNGVMPRIGPRLGSVG